MESLLEPVDTAGDERTGYKVCVFDRVAREVDDIAVRKLGDWLV